MLGDKVNLAEKLAEFTDHWAPRTVAQLNEYDIRSSRFREHLSGTRTRTQTISSSSSLAV